MAHHDPKVCLRQMLDHAREAMDLARGRTREDIGTDRTVNLALTRLLEIIGEAANRIPPQQQARYPLIAWPQIIGLRNRLIHGYDQVDLDILWEIVTKHLPVLAAAIENVLAGA